MRIDETNFLKFSEPIIKSCVEHIFYEYDCVIDNLKLRLTLCLNENEKKQLIKNIYQDYSEKISSIKGEFASEIRDFILSDDPFNTNPDMIEELIEQSLWDCSVNHIFKIEDTSKIISHLTIKEVSTGNYDHLLVSLKHLIATLPHLGIIEKCKEFLIKNNENKEDKNESFEEDIKANDTTKVRMLIELGVIDFLNENGYTHSVNSLSKTIGKIIEVPRTTVQSYLQGYLTDSNKNPMNNKTKVNQVRESLNNLGYIKPH